MRTWSLHLLFSFRYFSKYFLLETIFWSEGEVLNPIDMRDRDLILIISFVMHFTGIEGHSFLWLEKFPIAIHS